MFLVKQVSIVLNHRVAEVFGSVFDEKYVLCRCRVLQFVLLLFAVVPFPPENEFTNFYLLHNGSDTSDCGKSLDSACFSLLHVLKLYYAEVPMKGLEIVADKSLLLDNRTMVRFLQASQILIKCRNNAMNWKWRWARHFLQESCTAFSRSMVLWKSLEPSNNVTVNVTNIKFGACEWLTTDIVLNILQCDIKSMGIIIQYTEPNEWIDVQITDSQIGSFLLYNANVSMTNCSNTAGVIGEDEVYITVYNSSIVLKYSLFENISAGAILWVASGIVHIFDVQFTNCIPASSLVFVSDKTLITVENCTFSSMHGSLIGLTNTSAGFIENCIFRDNRMVHNSSAGQPLIQVSFSFIQVTNCQFLNNTNPAGSTLEISDESIGVVNDSDFSNNTAMIGAAICVFHGTIQVNNCGFFSNWGGGLYLVNTSDSSISSCSFYNNTARYGGAIYVRAE